MRLSVAIATFFAQAVGFMFLGGFLELTPSKVVYRAYFNNYVQVGEGEGTRGGGKQPEDGVDNVLSSRLLEHMEVQAEKEDYSFGSDTCPDDLERARADLESINSSLEFAKAEHALYEQRYNTCNADLGTRTTDYNNCNTRIQNIEHNLDVVGGRLFFTDTCELCDLQPDCEPFYCLINMPFTEDGLRSCYDDAVGENIFNCIKNLFRTEHTLQSLHSNYERIELFRLVMVLERWVTTVASLLLYSGIPMYGGTPGGFEIPSGTCPKIGG